MADEHLIPKLTPLEDRYSRNGDIDHSQNASRCNFDMRFVCSGEFIHTSDTRMTVSLSPPTLPPPPPPPNS